MTKKLDLGSGDTPKEGFEGVDLFSEKAQHRINLCKFPWPWADSSVEALHSSHFLEHLPMVYVTSGGEFVTVPESNDRDLLCKFMDEAYRVLVPGGEFTLLVPSGRSNRGLQDPTHRRFFVAESFLYFNQGWRENRGLGHYLCDCNFDVSVNTIVPDELLKLPREVQEQKVSAEWNATIDWNITLVSKKAKEETKVAVAKGGAGGRGGSRGTPSVNSSVAGGSGGSASGSSAAEGGSFDSSRFFPYGQIDCFVVIDNFLSNPDAARRAALEQTFVESPQYKGFRATTQNFSEEIHQKLQRTFKTKIMYVGASFMYHWTPAGTPEVFHADPKPELGDWGGVLYLTPGAPVESGTGLFMHKKTSNRMGDPAVYVNMPAPYCYLDPTEWVMTDFVGNFYNRLVLFRGDLIHSMRNPFGFSKETARMTQLFFVTLEK